MNRNWSFRVILVLAVVTGAGAYLWQTVDFDLVVHTLLAASIPMYILGLTSFYITVPIRTKRWKVLLKDIDVDMQFTWLNGIVFQSLYFNTILPAKSGDFYRGYRTANESGKSTSTVVATIVVERAFDLLVLIGLLVAISFQTFHRIIVEESQLIGIFILGGGLVAVLVFLATFRYDYFSWLQKQIDGFYQGLHCIGSFHTFVSFLTLTVILWGLNVIRIAALAQAVEIGLGAGQVVLIAVIVTILSGLPFTPAGIGVVEGVTTATLVGIGVSNNAGLALVLLDRSITIVSVVILGSLYLIYQTNTLRPWDAINDSAPDSEVTRE